MHPQLMYEMPFFLWFGGGVVVPKPPFPTKFRSPPSFNAYDRSIVTKGRLQWCLADPGDFDAWLRFQAVYDCRLPAVMNKSTGSRKSPWKTNPRCDHQPWLSWFRNANTMNGVTQFSRHHLKIQRVSCCGGTKEQTLDVFANRNFRLRCTHQTFRVNKNFCGMSGDLFRRTHNPEALEGVMILSRQTTSVYQKPSFILWEK